jgi:hypothetical protein
MIRRTLVAGAVIAFLAVLGLAAAHATESRGGELDAMRAIIDACLVFATELPFSTVARSFHLQASALRRAYAALLAVPAVSAHSRRVVREAVVVLGTDMICRAVASALAALRAIRDYLAVAQELGTGRYRTHHERHDQYRYVIRVSSNVHD